MKIPGSPDAGEARRLLSLITERPAAGPSRLDGPVALYGGGELGKMAKEYFDRVGIDVSLVVDANPAKCLQDPFWSHGDIRAPHEVDQDTKNSVVLVVCVAAFPFREIAHTLRALRWKHFVHFYDIIETYRDRHPLSNGWFAGDFSINDMEGIGSVLARWADDVSRCHHLQFLAWRRLREEWHFGDAPVTTQDRFFIPEVTSVITHRESFADVGAHHGTVALRFLKTVKGRFDAVWAIEPDSESVYRLRRLVSTLEPETRERVTILPAALGSVPGIRSFFQGLGHASQLSPLGDETVSVETFDSLCISPTFVKLHLEGAELDVLCGMEETLERCRPLLATTSYHNRLGLWELPLWLMHHLPDYEFLMRLHGWCGSAAVVYSIPKERITGRTSS